MSKITSTSTITLNNGVQIPVIGFGVFRIPDGQEVETAIKIALEAGYRSIDTAMIYKNEIGTGKAIKESGIPRKEIFVTTKLWNTDQGYENTLKAIDTSLDKLGLSYVDLYLIHWPTASAEEDENKNYLSLDKRAETWKAMEEILHSGKAKAIGVSNYMVKHLEEMKKYAKIMPAINQIELHPFLYQKELIEYCKENNIVVEAHSPLAPLADIKSPGHEPIDAIAAKYNKTTSQVLLRWNIQHGIIPLPKSIHKERIEENLNVFDFEINTEDMLALDNMNINLHVRRDSNYLK
ncbi:aldo/keto reductase [Patescibacteria group bacterium]|nr:aldo/keto reductase [Patescibacteria group bacterium]